MLALMTGRLYAIARNGGFKLNKKQWEIFTLSLSQLKETQLSVFLVILEND